MSDNLKAVNETCFAQLKQMRKRLGMTQEQLAEKAKVSQGMVAEIETGRSKNPCISTLQKLAEAMNCNMMIGVFPLKDPDVYLDERSTELARRIIAVTSGSTAIEMQLPDKRFLEAQFQKTKEDILKNHRSLLWIEK